MAAPVLRSAYFDGQRPVAQPVELWVDGAALQIRGEGLQREVPLRSLRWPERQRHGPRQLLLPGQGEIHHADGPGWDAWAAASGVQEAGIVRWMQSWRRAAAALVLSLALGFVAWGWGVPALAAAVAAGLPAAAEVALGDQALQALDRAGAGPSRLPPARQAQIRQAFAAAVAADGRPAPAWQLHFRAADRLALGPNALALPGGHIVMTDALVELLADAPDVITGVLAHELGHVRERHALQAMVQASLVAGLTAAVLGDVSSLLAAVPVLLAQASYARDAEREADAEAARVMRAAGLSPQRMAVLFERLQAWQADQPEAGQLDWPIALASHPADAERIRFFRDASR